MPNLGLLDIGHAGNICQYLWIFMVVCHSRYIEHFGGKNIKDVLVLTRSVQSNPVRKSSGNIII